MPTAKKLPSGSWRCQVYSHTETTPGGRKKRIYKSFTSPDKSRAGKRAAERMASDWLQSRSDSADITFGKAVRMYIDSRDGLLSPSTIRAYNSYAKHRIGSISGLSVREADQIALQTWLTELRTVHELSPKTIRCVYGLVNAAYHEVTKRSLDLSLPAKVQPDLHTPTDDEIRALLQHVKCSDLEIAIILSALCSLRRGEICALCAEDLEGDVLTVRSNMVRDQHGAWVIKAPKTETSTRTVIVPKIVQDYFSGRSGRIFRMTPDSLSKRFLRAVRYVCKHDGVQRFRFHDLRHYYASIAHALGVPEAFVMAQGGWKSPHVMKRVYREALPDRMRSEAEKVTGHLSSLM